MSASPLALQTKHILPPVPTPVMSPELKHIPTGLHSSDKMKKAGLGIAYSEKYDAIAVCSLDVLFQQCAADTSKCGVGMSRKVNHLLQGLRLFRMKHLSIPANDLNHDSGNFEMDYVAYHKRDNLNLLELEPYVIKLPENVTSHARVPTNFEELALEIRAIAEDDIAKPKKIEAFLAEFDKALHFSPSVIQSALLPLVDCRVVFEICSQSSVDQAKNKLKQLEKDLQYFWVIDLIRLRRAPNAGNTHIGVESTPADRIAAVGLLFPDSDLKATIVEILQSKPEKYPMIISFALRGKFFFYSHPTLAEKVYDLQRNQKTIVDSISRLEGMAEMVELEKRVVVAEFEKEQAVRDRVHAEKLAASEKEVAKMEKEVAIARLEKEVAIAKMEKEVAIAEELATQRLNEMRWRGGF